MIHDSERNRDIVDNFPRVYLTNLFPRALNSEEIRILGITSSSGRIQDCRHLNFENSKFHRNGPAYSSPAINPELQAHDKL